MAGFIKPQLATSKSKAPVGSQWLHEIKLDGYRVQIHLNKGERKVHTRNGLDWTKRFPRSPAPSRFPDKPSSTRRSWSSTKAAPISQNSRLS
jgi:ATP-dependent DNA ligase